jgi:hypothetical protein
MTDDRKVLNGEDNERSEKKQLEKHQQWYASTTSSTLPLSKHAPPRTAIRKNKATPRAFLADLDDSLPRRRQASICLFDSPVAVLLLARKANDLLARALDRQFSRFLLRGSHASSRV